MTRVTVHFVRLSAPVRNGPVHLVLQARRGPGELLRLTSIWPVGETQLCDLNAPVNRHVRKCRGPSHTRRRRRPRARTGVENLAPARGSGAARDTLEAQLKKRPKFKAPRPAGRRDAPSATRRPPRRAETPRRRRQRRPLQLVGRRLAEGRGGRPRWPHGEAPRVKSFFRDAHTALADSLLYPPRR